MFDLVIKSMVISKGNKQVQKLHEETSNNAASAQSAMMRAMQPYLTEEEHTVYRGDVIQDRYLRRRISRSQITAGDRV